MSDDARTDELGDEDRLPWLEAVEEDEEREGPSVAKLIAAILIGLVAIGLIVGGLFWLGNRGREGGDGELIAAEEGDYKVRPRDQGGMNVSGTDNTAQAASKGDAPAGRIDTAAVPEAPVARPAPARRVGGDPRTWSPKARPAPQPPRPAPALPRPAPAPAPAASGATIQLGAFSTEARATRAWNAMAARFRYLAPLSHSVVPVRTGSRTLYRLRASGANAAAVCRRLRVAGEDCAVVG